MNGNLFTYLAAFIRIIDGDTYEVEVDLGFHIKTKMKIRLRGVNTPELKGNDKLNGLKAKNFVTEIFFTGPGSKLDAIIRTHKTDKYGRYVADVQLLSGSDLATLLLNEGLAVKVDYEYRTPA